MEKYKLTNIEEEGGKKITYTWHPGIIPAGIPVQGVRGFCSTADGLVALVREKGKEGFLPPGGGSEEGETPLEALHREFMEEAQFVPEDIKLLGSLEVTNSEAQDEIQKHNLQVRFVCRIGRLESFVPLRDDETEERIFVYYKNLPDYVEFIKKYQTGKIQYEMYCDYLEGTISL